MIKKQQKKAKIIRNIIKKQCNMTLNELYLEVHNKTYKDFGALLYVDTVYIKNILKLKGE